MSIDPSRFERSFGRAIADALMRLAIGGLCNFVEGEVMLGVRNGDVTCRKEG